jgi:RNA polymerase sigma-70 factor (ECF subfamily)
LVDAKIIERWNGSRMDRQQHQRFAERMIRDQARLFGFILSLVPNRADAEELFQQTSLTLWENWERYNPELDFFPWACGIARNHVRNFIRKQQRGPVQLDADVIEAIADRALERCGREVDRVTALRKCVAELSERSRNAIEQYYNGKAVNRIAEEAGDTANAVYKLLRRSREFLHECVKKRLSVEATS